jgi:hypothetical protein
MKMKNVLRAVAFVAALGLVGSVVAAGFPTQVSLNSEVGSTANGGQVFGNASALTNTPMLLCQSPANCGWLESIVLDTAVGASATATVTLYDATSTAMCNSSAVIYTFTVATATAGTVGVQPVRKDLDAFVHGNLYVGITANNPDTVTASVVLGKTVDSKFSVIK